MTKYFTITQRISNYLFSLMKKITISTLSIYFISCTAIEPIKNKEDSKSLVVDSLLKKGAEFNKDKDFYSALDIYDKLITIDSSRGDLYFKRANCKAQLLKFESSSKDYFKALELHYRIEDTYYNLGCNFASIDKDSAAIEYFMKALEIDPNDLDTKLQIKIVKNKLINIKK